MGQGGDRRYGQEL